MNLSSERLSNKNASNSVYLTKLQREPKEKRRVSRISPFKSLHIYFEKIHFDKDEINRPIVVSEYGGYGLRIKNHLGCSEYFSYIMFKDKKDLTMNIKNLLSDEIYPAMKRGLCAAVYTQLSDVEQEINGFLTYDRKVLKVNASEIKQVNDMIKLK